MKIEKLIMGVVFMMGISCFKAQSSDIQREALFRFSKELKAAELFRLFKENTINPNIKDDNGFSPLYYACQSAVNANKKGPVGLHTIDLLLKNGADANMVYGTLKNKKTLLGFLIEDNYWPKDPKSVPVNIKLRIAKVLIKDGRADVSAPNQNGDELLYFAVRNPQNGLGFINLLVQSGADVNHQNNNGNTALHEAVKRNNCEAVEALMKNGANPMLKNNKGQSPEDLAIENHSPCMNLLLPQMPVLAQ